MPETKRSTTSDLDSAGGRGLFLETCDLEFQDKIITTKIKNLLKQITL